MRFGAPRLDLCLWGEDGYSRNVKRSCNPIAMGKARLMLMQLLAPLIGLLSFALALLAQFVDFILLTLTDIIGVIRHGLTRLSALLGRRPPPK